MPTYRYECRDCEHALELFHSMSAPPVKTCPSCNKPSLIRVVSGGVGIIFKGGGFYTNDAKQVAASAKSQKNSAADAPVKSEKKDSQSPTATPDVKTAAKSTPSAASTASSS